MGCSGPRIRVFQLRDEDSVYETFDRAEMLAMTARLTERTRRGPEPVFAAIRHEMRERGADPDTWAVALLDMEDPLGVIVVSPTGRVASFLVDTRAPEQGLKISAMDWEWDQFDPEYEGFVRAAKEFLNL